MVEIHWQGNVPRSRRFDDIYYSLEDGLAETQYLFLHINQLRERWRQAELGVKQRMAPEKGQDGSYSKNRFTICELGFGTGLNFCAIYKAFADLALPNLSLYYISCEKYPLSVEQMQRALGAFPQLVPYDQKLLDAYSKALTHSQMSHKNGQERTFCVRFDENRIGLRLYHGDVAWMFKQWKGEVNAWFMDGFAPEKNAEMWNEETCRSMARLSAQDSICSSFSVAGRVRRNLYEAGFEVERVPGFAKKRQALRARYKRSQ